MAIKEMAHMSKIDECHENIMGILGPAKNSEEIQKELNI
jgi:hypothetical protein